MNWQELAFTLTALIVAGTIIGIVISALVLAGRADDQADNLGKRVGKGSSLPTSSEERKSPPLDPE